MAKTFNIIAAKAIARVNATIPQGVNWKQTNAANAALIICETLLLGEGQKAAPEIRQQAMTALNDVVNPSACLQAMDKLPTTDPCYRKKISDAEYSGEPA
jgi:hypothetical protein